MFFDPYGGKRWNVHEIKTNYGLLLSRYKNCCFRVVQDSNGQDMVRVFIIGTIAEEDL